MSIIRRLLKSELMSHWKGCLAVLLIGVMVSATPYAFAMMGRWLVDDVLQVTRKIVPPDGERSEEQVGDDTRSESSSDDARGLDEERHSIFSGSFLLAAWGFMWSLQ
ncbi:MAG: hypothetical protein ACLFWL_09575 [Candidatus Brocadiia bacterium]